MSQEAAQQFLQKYFGTKNVDTLNEIYKTVTGQSLDLRGFDQFSQAMISYLMDPKNNKGLLGFIDRYPNSTGQDVRLVN